jgi:hypothetical protein
MASSARGGAQPTDTTKSSSHKGAAQAVFSDPLSPKRAPRPAKATVLVPETPQVIHHLVRLKVVRL